MEATWHISNIKISWFPSFFIIPRMFRRNLTEVGQTTYSINSLKVDAFLPKSNARFLLIKVHKQLGQVRRLSRFLKPQTNGTTGPPNVIDDGPRFPGKSKPWQTHLFVSIVHWSVNIGRHDIGKICKRKRKTADKVEKPGYPVRSHHD